MHAARHSFLILQICGLWRPINWPDNSRKAQLYQSYTILLSFLIATVTIFEFIYLISVIDDIEKFANNSFMLLSMIGMCGKALNILNRRNLIIELTAILKNDVCRACDNEETILQRRFDDTVRSNTLWYGALTESTVVMMYIASILQDIPRKAFPFDTWLPWNRSSTIGYWFGYTHQIISHGAGATINVACDTLVAGLMVQACGQFNILKNRFEKMPRSIENAIGSLDDDKIMRKINIERTEENFLSRCIKHHLTIIEITKRLNSLFEEIIFLQFSISTLVLCVSVYQLSTLTLFSAEFTSIILYLSCMSVQVFFLCYYGSEITLESTAIGNAIYTMNWNELSTRTKKSLLTMMIRTSRPIKCTSASIIILNLDSFNSLIKLSYSAFNLLQQSSQ